MLKWRFERLLSVPQIGKDSAGTHASAIYVEFKVGWRVLRLGRLELYFTCHTKDFSLSSCKGEPLRIYK